jgi:DNA-binding transcriptional ArsR family regulator
METPIGDPTMHDMPWDVLEMLAGRFGLLANPARLAILQQLCRDDRPELTVGALVGRTGLKQSHVSRQLSLLDAGGLVRRRAEGNHVHYALADTSLPDLCAIVHASLAEKQDEIAAKLRGGLRRSSRRAAARRASAPARA